MKKILFVVVLLGVGQMALADFTRPRRDAPAVHCRTNPNVTPAVSIQIDKSRGSQWQDATVSSGSASTNHQVMIQNSITPNEVSYWGNDFDLKIDTFITGRPEYNRNYTSRFSSRMHSNGTEMTIECEFLPF